MKTSKKIWLLPAISFVILLAGFDNVKAAGGKKDKKEKKEGGGVTGKVKGLLKKGGDKGGDAPPAEAPQEPQQVGDAGQPQEGNDGNGEAQPADEGEVPREQMDEPEDHDAEDEGDLPGQPQLPEIPEEKTTPPKIKKPAPPSRRAPQLGRRSQKLDPELASGRCGPGTWISAAAVITVVSYVSWWKFFSKKAKQKPNPDNTLQSSDNTDQREE